MTWWDLAQLMTTRWTPEPTLQGVIRSAGTDAEAENTMNWAVVVPHQPPLFTGDRNRVRPTPSDPNPERLLRVWRDGPRVRIEDRAGDPLLITDGTSMWEFPDADAPAVFSTGRTIVFQGSGTHLLQRRTVPDLVALGEPVDGIREARVLGRDAWWVTVDKPEDEQGKRELMVDAETGMILRHRDAVWGGVDEWAELTVGEPLDPSLFTHDGPTRTPADAEAARYKANRATDDKQREWFARHVTPTPLQIEIVLDLDDVYVQTKNNKTGAFEASLVASQGRGSGTLARRPHSTTPWKLRWASVDHRWSTTRWDWALTLHGLTLSDTGLAALQTQLDDAP